MSAMQQLQSLGSKIKHFLTNPHHNSWILSHLHALGTKNLFQTIGLIILISSMVFLLNIILGIKLGVDNAANNVKEKLGVFVYIKSIPSQEDRITEQVIEMKTALEKKGLIVEYYSRQDAYNTLSKKVPDIIESFDRYGISNPLPATMYIMFKNSSEYVILKDIATKYQPIIINSLDTTQDAHLRKQEDRIMNIINLADIVSVVAYGLVILLVSIIVVFLLFIVRIKFYGFKDTIQVQKLLGAKYLQIKGPYLLHVIIILTVGTVIAGMALGIIHTLTHDEITALYNKSLLELVNLTERQVVGGLIIQLLGIGGLSTIAGNLFLDRLLKKM